MEEYSHISEVHKKIECLDWLEELVKEMWECLWFKKIIAFSWWGQWIKLNFEDKDRL